MSGFLGRYSRILLAIVVFLILVLSVLGLNFYNSFRVETDAKLVDEIGVQSALAQRISKSLLQTFADYSSGADYTDGLAELKDSSAEFEAGLQVLIKDSQLAAVDDSAVDDATKIWEPLYKRLNEIERRLVEEQEQTGGESLATRDSLLQLASTSKVGTVIMEGLVTELSEEVLAAKETEAAYEIERHAISAIKMEELILFLSERYFKGQDVGELSSQLREIVDGLTIAVNDYASGQLQVQGQKNFSLAGLNNDIVQQIIDDIQIVWAPLRSDTSALLDALDADADQSTTPSLFLDALSYTSTNMNEVSSRMDSLSEDMSGSIKKSADTNRLIQLAGVVGSSLCFLFILGAFFGRLRKSDADVQTAQKESQQIFDTVDQGLFLLDGNAQIGGQHSKELLNIFGTEKVAKVELVKFLRNIVSEADLEKLTRYLKLLFDPHKKEKLIRDLNPLEQVSIQVHQDGKIVNKHLRFGFSRVLADGKVDNVLTSVSDISKEVRLQSKLDQETRRGEQQLNLLTALLNTNQELLPVFIDNSNKAYEAMNSILKEDAKTSDEYRVKAEKLGVIVHKVKGESAALSIGMVADACHEFEDELGKILENHHIDGNSFLPLTILLERLLGYNKLVADLHERVFINNSQPKSSVKNVAESVNWDHLGEFCSEVAERADKNVKFRHSGLDSVMLPESIKSALPVLTSQLLRNAVVHGIESSEERAKAGKPKVGRVSISAYREAGGIVFECFDDGYGIDVDQIAKKAVQQKLVSEQSLKKMSDNQIIALIFKAGFSMQDSADEDSGRGMGMPAISDIVKELGGRVSVSTKLGAYTRFSIHFPEADSLLKSA